MPILWKLCHPLLHYHPCILLVSNGSRPTLNRIFGQRFAEGTSISSPGFTVGQNPPCRLRSNICTPSIVVEIFSLDRRSNNSSSL
jgi:hypothetical protein